MKLLKTFLSLNKNLTLIEKNDSTKSGGSTGCCLKELKTYSI